ncbi:MAG: DUF502 domain-containing protein [Pseudomonadota bacterium]
MRSGRSQNRSGQGSARRSAKGSSKPTFARAIEGHGARPLGLLARLRNYLFAGIIVTAPIGITIFLVVQIVSFFDAKVVRFLPQRYNPETYLPFSLPGLGLLTMVMILIFIGWFAAGLVGRSIMRGGEHLLDRMPIIRSIYGTLKQIFETVLAQSSGSFREVVLIEYPREGIWAIGFVTSDTQGEVQDRTERDLVNVFLPTTPNPTSGFLLFVPREDLVHLDITVEEGVKMVISSGIVTPPRRNTAEPEPAEVEEGPLATPVTR